MAQKGPTETEPSHNRDGKSSNFWVKLALLFILALIVLIPLHYPQLKQHHSSNATEREFLEKLGFQCDQDPCTLENVAQNLTQSSIHELETAAKLAEIVDEMRPSGNLLRRNSVTSFP